MGYNVNSLPAYVNENNHELVRRALLSGRTMGLVSKMDVIGTAAMHIIETTPVFADGSDCAFNPQGETAITARNITTKLVEAQGELCEKALWPKYTQYAMELAANPDKAPFEAEIAGEIADKTALWIEEKIWQGDSALGIDGLLSVIASDGGVDANLSAGVSVFEAIQTVILAVKPAVVGKVSVFVGDEVYNKLMMEMVNKNLFHYSGNEVASKTFVFPGTSIKVEAVPGLNGTGKIVAADPKNLVVGMHFEPETSFDMWYSKDDRVFKYDEIFNLGANTPLPDEIVYATLA